MMKKGNNKGFSLIEIVIGIGMLAVIVIPILHTFITSAQLNRDSRQVMIQTEVAQTIMEGFAGKTYADVKASVGALASNGGVSGNKALSTIDNNLFNTAGAYVLGVSGTSPIQSALTAVSCNKLTWQGTEIDTQSLVSDNSVIVSMNQMFGIEQAARFEVYKMSKFDNADDPQMRMLYSSTISDGMALFLAYGNINYEGYRFDAVVSFLPMAEASDDIYYTYRILLTLYEYQPNMGPGERFKHLLMTMDGGIMAGDL